MSFIMNPLGSHRFRLAYKQARYSRLIRLVGYSIPAQHEASIPSSVVGRRDVRSRVCGIFTEIGCHMACHCTIITSSTVFDFIRPAPDS